MKLRDLFHRPKVHVPVFQSWRKRIKVTFEIELLGKPGPTTLLYILDVKNHPNEENYAHLARFPRDIERITRTYLAQLMGTMRSEEMKKLYALHPDALRAMTADEIASIPEIRDRVTAACALLEAK